MLPTITSLPPWEFADFEPAHELCVVHSSPRRLRVHLPLWSGERAEEISAALTGFHGVTHAEANPITGNVLVLFDSEQTSAATLLETLPALRLEAPLKELFPAGVVGAEGERETVYMTGMGRVIYQALGWASVGMAVVGAILPGIPTVPFVVLAGYFFVRSSPESHQWLRQSRWFGPMLRDWEDHRGIRRSIRNAAIALIGVGMAVTALAGLPMFLAATIIACQIIGIIIVMNLRVVEPTQPALTAGV